MQEIISYFEILLLLSWRETFVAANVRQRGLALIGNNHQKLQIMTKFAFVRGWNKVPKGITAQAKQDIKDALCIKSDPQFYRRMKGAPEPTLSEAEKIEAVFGKYGITDIWGDE